jgi:PKD repeat protein
VTVTAPNQAPTANFTFSCSGLTCSFTSTSSDPDGTIAAYSWTFGDGTSSTAQNPSKTYAAGGSYTVTLTVTDNQGALSAPTSKSVTVTAPNQAPTANFTFSCSGLTCSFTSTSSDPDGTIASYNWTFGDGTSSTAQNPSKTYAAGGSYTVTLTVTDNQGALSAPTSKTVTVTAPNQAPTANFTFSCSGLTCSFTSTSSDPDGTIASYNWTFGDGTSSTVQNPSKTYAAGGSYTVTLRVTDNQGAVSAPTSKTVTVTAPNSAPVVDAGPDETAVTGLLYTLRWSFSDANGNGPWSYRIEWGDGSTSTGSVSSQGTFSTGHTYVVLLPRDFTIRVTVTDGAGASGSDTKVVTVLLL